MGLFKQNTDLKLCFSLPSVRQSAALALNLSHYILTSSAHGGKTLTNMSINCQSEWEFKFSLQLINSVFA